MGDTLELQHLLIIAAAGVVSGTLNVLAGGGSLLVMPLFLEFGLTGPAANGTARLGVITQSSAAMVRFFRGGFRPDKTTLFLVLATLPGAASGALIGTQLKGSSFRYVLAAVMLTVGTWMFISWLRKPKAKNEPRICAPGRRPRQELRKPKAKNEPRICAPGRRPRQKSRKPKAKNEPRICAPGRRPRQKLRKPKARNEPKEDASDDEVTPMRVPWWGYLLVVGVGFYGGFIQAGVGFLVMAVLHQALGIDLVRVNAFKVWMVFGYTLVAIGVFVSEGAVEPIAGAALAVGTGIGGWIGARLTITRGEGLIRVIFSIALVALIARLVFFS